MSKRKTILIYALTITVLAVSIIGFTYAWFSTEIDGDVGDAFVDDTSAFVPVVSVKSGVKVVGGNGSATSPYELSL